MKRIGKEFWAYWENKTFLMNTIISILPISLYYFGFMSNIRENTGSIITFAVGILTVDGVFLTLLITLKSSPVMERLKTHFSGLHDYLYIELKKQILYCLYFLMINLAIAVTGPIANKFIISMGIILWSYLIVHITLGFIFSLRVIMNLSTSTVDTKKKMN
ncbi:hypothetical protein NSQ62_11760 [Solibacillus sp. FSL H8-0523]|uniref:hypothetical protein n=1 Tax=Solibacillus sp. FSL H8-0523 TaxID=2954511 RepID=UPI0031017659